VAWKGRDRGSAGATASLDQPCARLPRRNMGRDEGKAAVEQEKAEEEPMI
jgi:hypothetical protein